MESLANGVNNSKSKTARRVFVPSHVYQPTGEVARPRKVGSGSSKCNDAQPAPRPMYLLSRGFRNLTSALEDVQAVMNAALSGDAEADPLLTYKDLEEGFGAHVGRQLLVTCQLIQASEDLVVLHVISDEELGVWETGRQLQLVARQPQLFKYNSSVATTRESTPGSTDNDDHDLELIPRDYSTASLPNPLHVIPEDAVSSETTLTELAPLSKAQSIGATILHLVTRITTRYGDIVIFEAPKLLRALRDRTDVEFSVSALAIVRWRLRRLWRRCRRRRQRGIRRWQCGQRR